MGAPKLASGIVQELHDLLAAQLPSFVSSTHVEVSERANLALQLASFAKADAEKMSTAGPLFKDPLLPVASDAQQQLAIPVGLNLDEPCYELPSRFFSQKRADPADPYQLARCAQELCSGRSGLLCGPFKPEFGPCRLCLSQSLLMMRSFSWSFVACVHESQLDHR